MYLTLCSLFLSRTQEKEFNLAAFAGEATGKASAYALWSKAGGCIAGLVYRCTTLMPTHFFFFFFAHIYI